jgi:YebC/PmpR family DNA-binding regulatory protein
MAGHNKWSKIKHKKGAEDAKRSKVFSRLAHQISVEARQAGGDTASPALRSVIEKARQANMPAANIERALKKGSGKDALDTEEVVYEAYGPGGVAMIIVGLTDNKNRTSQEVKHALSKHNSSLGANGSALWAFEKDADGYAPQVSVPLEGADHEKLGALVEALEENDDIENVYTNAA